MSSRERTPRKVTLAREKSGEKSGPDRPAEHPSPGFCFHPPGGFRRGPDPRRGAGPAPGAPNAGRPKKATRLLYCEILATEGAQAARDALAGRPDELGRVADHAERRAWLREIAEVAFNGRLAIAKAEASADGGAPESGNFEVIVQGGPTDLQAR